MKLLFPYIFERYLARQIYAAFGFILFALVALFLFFDILSELGSVKGQYTLPLALLHVLLKAPSRISEIIPIASLIGSIYVFAMLASQSEFTILRIAGLDMRRGLTTLAKISLPLVIVTLVMSEWLGPYTENLSDQIRMKALGSSYSSQFKTGIWVKDRLRDEDGSGPIRPGVRYVNVGKIEQDNEIKNIRMYEFDDAYRLLSIRSAVSGRFEHTGTWILDNVTETRFKESKQIDPLNPVYSAQTFSHPIVSLDSEVTPQILSVLLVNPEKMSIFSLGRFISHLRENKQDAQRHSIAFWKKVIYPFTIFVMLALALPFAYLKVRAGSVGIKVFGGIMLGMSFQLFNSLFSNVGLLGSWPALLTALTPPLLYFILAIVGLRWVSKA
ncbi:MULTISPECIES: LPS export ABC transporter permease LptG [unclassified Polynucleobacter]|jgi:lipopolysaccharide export system permease protein|uniref:LPS export ABC transporter permease LptG n=1 Tax=unclassified Polynucleobacter TaxID=2640945 RepID=UPI000BCF689A|nr:MULTISPECIES: LPS export ABC transporter permease LptG [unclassified Polynucleobacter]OYY19004.1 MAG: LPS export ABC transporter permease LptG [Polynucleobacter sp. 35-46-11]OZA76597.1 MAG: LPS export ABC transporter permease LptG [Polynucleobacter sp. 39-46-10]